MESGRVKPASEPEKTESAGAKPGHPGAGIDKRVSVSAIAQSRYTGTKWMPRCSVRGFWRRALILRRKRAGYERYPIDDSKPFVG